MWQVLYAPFETEVFVNITRYVIFPVSFSQDLGKNLLSFSLDTQIIKDENGVVITVRTGDYILVTKDINYNQVIFFGTAKKPKYKLITFDQINQKWKKTNKFTSREKSFSLKESDYTYSFRDLNYVTNDILSKTKLGGTMSNGTVISKYVLGCENINIGNFSVSYQGEMEAIISMLEENLLFFKLLHFCEPDTIKTVKVYSQVYIFDNTGDVAPAHWTVTDSNLSQGMIINPDYRGDKRIEPEYLVGWLEPQLEEDEDDIINSINIQSKVLFTGDTSDLERYERIADEKVDAYLLPYQAREIAYISNNPIRTRIITSPTAPTTTSFNIDHDVSWQFKTGNIIMILTTSNIQYFREISLVNGDNLTITNPLPFTPNGTEIVELASNLAIYLDSANFSQSIEEGVVIDTSSNKDSKIRFLKRSIPNVGTSFICYYSKVLDYPEQQTFQESVNRYELRGFSKNLEGIFTKDQVKKIVQTIQNEKTNPVFTVKCFLPEVPSIGWKIWIDLTDTLKGFFKITSFDSKYYGQFRGKDVVESTLTISNKKQKASDYIKLVERKAKESLIRSSAPPNVHLSYNESIIITDTAEITKNLALIPTYSILALPSSDPTSSHFKVNWKSISGGFRYLIDVARDVNFTNYILKNFAFNTLQEPNTTLSQNVNISGNYPFYYRIKAIINDKLVATSNTISTDDISNDLQKDSNTLTFLRFQNNYSDETSNHNNVTPVNSPTFGAGIIAGDTHSLILDGSNDYLEFANDFDFSTTQEFTFRIVFQELLNTITASYKALFYIYDVTINDNQVLVGCYYDNNYFYFSIYSWDYHSLNGINDAHNYCNFKFARDIIQNSANIMQIAFKQSTRDFKVHLNGIEKTVIWNSGNYTLSNILANWARKSPLRIGAYKDVAGINHGDLAFPNIKLARFAVDKIYRNGSFALQDAKNLKLLDLQIDSSTLIAWNYQEGLGTIINSSSPATLVGSVIGDASSIWQSGLLVKDLHSLKLNGINNFVQTANYSGTITDFTIRRVFRFNTGDKSSKSSHILFSRYDTFLSQDDNTAVFTLEYNSVNNQISMFLNDVSGSFANLKYRNPYFVYNLNENQDYIIQASFKLQDPNNSNLNKIEICINGIPQILNYSNDTISNISALNQVNIPFFDSTYRANNGVRYYSKYSNSRAVFDLRFRTSSEALTDAQNLGLA